MKFIDKIKSLFTPNKWNTIWMKEVEGTKWELFSGAHVTTIYIKLQVSTKNKWRMILTDGIDISYYDADIVFNKCPSAKHALEEWARNNN